MHVPIKLNVHATENAKPELVTVYVEITENITKSELVQKVTEKSTDILKTEPKSCTVLINGKELAEDWKKSSRDGQLEAKIVKQ